MNYDVSEQTSNNGWTCSNCGEFVPGGMVHICTTTLPAVEDYDYAVTINPTETEELRLLREIRDSLLAIKQYIEEW